jgi:hypothetical protein
MSVSSSRHATTIGRRGRRRSPTAPPRTDPTPRAVSTAAQSRVFAYDQLGSISLLPAGLIVVGLVADHAGAADTLVAIAVLHLLLMLLAVTVRSVRSMTAEPPIAPVATA